mmetsp:Transcript_81940/g.211132  ORF Transcript_81940/g.211132 Transcript_81940/m.211132 type:complete len:289 (-) Transcript_81940:248-1114(-)
MDDLPLVVLAEPTLIHRAPHEPGIAVRELVGRDASAPPPDAEPRFAPEHNDAQLQGRLEANDGLVLGLADEARPQRPERLALVHARLLRHVLGDVRLDVRDGLIHLLRLRRREHKHARRVAEVRRLHDHLGSAGLAQVLPHKAIDLRTLGRPLDDQERRHLRHAEVLQQAVQHQLVAQGLDGAPARALLLHDTHDAAEIQAPAVHLLRHIEVRVQYELARGLHPRVHVHQRRRRCLLPRGRRLRSWRRDARPQPLRRSQRRGGQRWHGPRRGKERQQAHRLQLRRRQQ